MAPYIFMERNGIHIIDLHKTAAKMEQAQEGLKDRLSGQEDSLLSPQRNKPRRSWPTMQAR